MALLFHPPLFSLSIPPKRAFLGTKAPVRFSASAADVRAESGAAASSGAAILWYKQDLRIEDHPGIIAASQHRTVVPLYVFDRRIISRYSDELQELLLLALEDLRKLLKEKGSNLMIRFGTAEDVIGKLVNEVQASSIFVEEEVEYELSVVVDNVKESLSTLSFKGSSPKIVTWRTPFYDIKSLNDLPSSFHDFQKLKLSVLSVLEPPNLPATLTDLSWGTFPTMIDLKEYMDDGNQCYRKAAMAGIWRMAVAVSKKTAIKILWHGSFSMAGYGGRHGHGAMAAMAGYGVHLTQILLFGSVNPLTRSIDPLTDPN